MANRQTFTTYINALMDEGAERNFAKLDQLADKTFTSIQTKAGKSLSGVDASIAKFRNSFADVSKVIEGLSAGLSRGGAIDIDVSSLRQAAADARFFEEGLRTMLRTVALSARETGDATRETRDYILSLEAALRAAEGVSRETEHQVEVMSRYQDSLDRTASSSSKLAQAERERYSEQAKQGRADSVNSTRQDAINSRFAPALVRPAAIDAGAGFGALEAQAKASARAIEQTFVDGYARIAAGAASLDRSAIAGRTLEQVLLRVGGAGGAAAGDIDKAVEANRRLANSTAALANSATGYERLASGAGAIDRAALSGVTLDTVLRRVSVSSNQVEQAYEDQARAAQQLANAEAKAADEQDQLNASISRLRAAADPVVGVIQRFTKELEELERVRSHLSDSEYTNLQGDLTKRMGEQVEKVKQAQNAIAGYGNTLRGQRTAYVQSGQQLQDIAISFAGGQRASTIFAQQLPQLAYALQDVGGRAGKIATFFSGPWGLALVAASFVMGGLIDKLFGTGDAADKAKASNIDFTNSLEVSKGFVLDYATAIDALTSATRGLINTQAILTDSLASTARTQVDGLNSQLKALDGQISKLESSGFSGLVGSVTGVNSNSAAVSALRAERAEVVANLEKANTAFASAQTALDERRAQEDADSDVKARNQIGREKAELLLARRKTREQGDVPLAGFTPISGEDFNKQYQALEKREKALKESIKERGKAASQARSDAKAAAAQAAREAEAAAKRNATESRDEATLALLRRRAQLSPEEFERQKGLIADRYAAEMVAIDATTTATSKSTQIQIQNLTKLQEEGQKNSQTVQGIVAGYIDADSAVRRAVKSMAQVNALVGQRKNIAGDIFSPEDAERINKLIQEGLQRPFNDFLADQERSSEIARLQAAGFDDVARALEIAIGLQNDGATIGENQYNQILDSVRAQTSLNDALEVQRDINQQILGIARTTREETTAMIVGLAQGRGVNAIKDFGRNLVNNAIEIQAKQLTAKLFAGTDDKIRGLLDDSAGVTRAIKILEGNVKGSGSAVEKLESILGTASGAVKNFADALANATGSITGEGGGGAATGAPISLTSLDTVIEGLGAASKEFSEQNNGADITVTGRKQAKVLADALTSRQELSVGGAFGKTFNKIGEKLDKTLGTKFLAGVGSKLGQAAEGASKGAVASGIFGLTGVKQSKTGAAAGGALGNFIPGLPPGVGAAIGGIIGGTIGGLLKKTKKGSSSLTITDGFAEAGPAYGNSSSYRKNALALAGSLADQINSIADSLGAELGTASVSIGQRKKKFVVDKTGTRKTSGSGTVSFDDEQDAVEYAIRDALADGVLKGISAASQRILNSGQQLERSLLKATAIESIPKRLLQLTNPTKYAIQELNKEFEDLISYLKEGGATAEQFADAQKLYDLQRAEAIKQASDTTVDALQAYLTAMKDSESSPLSKRTVYGNAEGSFNALQAQVAAGQVVDQDKLLEAAQNFQDASENLYGSSSSFFADFDEIFDTITKAKGLAAGTATGTPGDLPASPFATDTAVADTISKIGQTQVDATNNQTTVIGKKLDDLNVALSNFLGRPISVGVGTGSAIGKLSSFGKVQQL